MELIGIIMALMAIHIRMEFMKFQVQIIILM